jgi:hypothetical protein
LGLNELEINETPNESASSLVASYKKEEIRPPVEGSSASHPIPGIAPDSLDVAMDEPPVTDTNEARRSNEASSSLVTSCNDEAQMECESSSDSPSVREKLPDITAYRMKELIIQVNPEPEVVPSSHVREENEGVSDPPPVPGIVHDSSDVAMSEPPMTDTNEPKWNEASSLACNEAQMESESSNDTTVREKLPDITAYRMKELIIQVNPDPESAPSSYISEEIESTADKRN